MTTLSVHFKGETHSLLFSDGVSLTVAALQEEIERVLGLQQDAQRLFQKRRRVDCSDVSKLLTDIQDMKNTQAAVHKEMKIRESRHVVDISKRNQGFRARDAVATNYRFHAIEPLENFADKDKAQEILEKLANDRGILAVMAKHKWSVGVLAEMPPDGKVGVDPVCVLGLNQNKGQKILLRLRTDDLLGFRKFLSIKKVLFHELSHNVHSEHDNKFYQLMRQVEKECNELDWTSSGGAAVGSSRVVLHDEHNSSQSSSDGRRLGGGSAGTSRLLNNSPPAPTAPEQLSPATNPAVKTQPSEPDTQRTVAGIAEDVKLEEAESEATAVASSRQSQTWPGIQERTVDEDVATMAMSDRERRIHDAVQHLQAQYSAEAIAKAVSLLHKIVSNIITHPADAKFRSIRKANRLFDGQVSKFPECLEFLLALGFEDQLDRFVLVREDPALLWIGRSTLEVLLSVPA